MTYDYSSLFHLHQQCMHGRRGIEDVNLLHLSRLSCSAPAHRVLTNVAAGFDMMKTVGTCRLHVHVVHQAPCGGNGGGLSAFQVGMAVFSWVAQWPVVTAAADT